jgi:hypothetical protein
VIPRLVCPELALDDDQRDALAGHLDGVRVAELVDCEAPADAGVGGGVARYARPPRTRRVRE